MSAGYDVAGALASFDQIKAIHRRCTCEKMLMRWYHFEYASDLIGFITGEPVWSDCCPEEED